MPRQPRYFLPGYCFHIVARGVNRQATFFDEQDYGLYLKVVHDAAKQHGCSIHAYVLMTNHVHLLMSPGTEEAIPLIFQAIGRSYVQTVNKKHERTGTLWEGRYKACVVDSDEYLLTCYRYIELNPVRAGLASSPSCYRWSSYHRNAMGRDDPVVSPHETYVALAPDFESRCEAYRSLFAEVMDERTLVAIRESTDACHVLGADRFKERVVADLGRPLGAGKRGRPRRD